MKSAPPTVVTVWGVLSSDVPTLVAIATLIYVILQSAHLLWRWRKERRRDREINGLMKGRIANPGERSPPE